MQTQVYSVYYFLRGSTDILHSKHCWQREHFDSALPGCWNQFRHWCWSRLETHLRRFASACREWPVGQCVVVELLLRLFVLHILGASPDCVAQPEGVTVEHRVWTSDGVAASLTSLGCLVVLQAARGELEASGRGSLHGHWEIWGVSLTMQTAIEQFADKPLQEKHSCLKNVVSQWINFFSERITVVLNIYRKCLVKQLVPNPWLWLKTCCIGAAWMAVKRT